MNAFHSMHRSLMWTMVLALAIVFGAAWMAASRTEVEAIADLRAEARSRLDLYRSNLVNSLNRHLDLALALVRNHQIKVLLDSPDNSVRADGVSEDFMHLAKATGVLAIFLINNDARVLSSSNFKGADSFVGESLDFRAYFKDALKAGVGRLFAIGTKNGVAGYYVAYATDDRRGVVVIKVAVNELEDAWQQAPERVMVTDRSGIVFLTNVDSWRYQSLLPLDVATAARLKSELQYNGKEIEPLPLRFVENEVFTTNDDRFLMETAPVPNSDWTLRVLAETNTIRDRTINATLIAAIATSSLRLFTLQLRHYA